MLAVSLLCALFLNNLATRHFDPPAGSVMWGYTTRATDVISNLRKGYRTICRVVSEKEGCGMYKSWKPAKLDLVLAAGTAIFLPFVAGFLYRLFGLCSAVTNS